MTVIGASAVLPVGRAEGQILRDELPQAAQGVGVTERLGERVPLRLEFTDASGVTGPLARFFDGEKPVVLMLGYYSCPVVCPTILAKLTESLKQLDYAVGSDFRVVTASINPEETPSHALAERTRQVEAYGRGDLATVQAGWAFLVGDARPIGELADAVGYRYKRLPSGEYSHPVVLAVLSPDGMVSRYFYGFDYPPKQMKIALLEASEGKIAESFGDKLMLFCYRWDESAGEYTMEAMAVMRVAGVLTVAGLVVFIGLLFAGERVRRGLRARGGSAAAGGPVAMGGQVN